MKNYILLTFLISLLTSCAQTKINTDSKKAVHWVNNDDIVSNQNIHEASFWTRQYKAEEVFPDNKEAQEKLNKANEAVKHYNIEKAYSVYPMIQRNDQNNKASLVFSASF